MTYTDDEKEQWDEKIKTLQAQIIKLKTALEWGINVDAEEFLCIGDETFNKALSEPMPEEIEYIELALKIAKMLYQIGGIGNHHAQLFHMVKRFQTLDKRETIECVKFNKEYNKKWPLT